MDDVYFSPLTYFASRIVWIISMSLRRIALWRFSADFGCPDNREPITCAVRTRYIVRHEWYIPCNANRCMDSLVVATVTTGLQGPGPTSFIALTRYLYWVSTFRPVNSWLVAYPLQFGTYENIDMCLNTHRSRCRTCIQFQIRLPLKHPLPVCSTSACRAPLGGKADASSAPPSDAWPCRAQEGLAARGHHLHWPKNKKRENINFGAHYVRY